MAPSSCDGAGEYPNCRRLHTGRTGHKQRSGSLILPASASTADIQHRAVARAAGQHRDALLNALAARPHTEAAPAGYRSRTHPAKPLPPTLSAHNTAAGSQLPAALAAGHNQDSSGRSACGQRTARHCRSDSRYREESTPGRRRDTLDNHAHLHTGGLASTELASVTCA